MKKIVARIFMWFQWKFFYRDMEKFIGYTSLDSLNYDLNLLVQKIRIVNGISVEQKITWDNSNKTDRAVFAQYITYITYKHFYQKGLFLKIAQNMLK